MKTRNVVIHTGERFEVPQGIQRIDHRSTHGWQLRYGGTKLYSDGARGRRRRAGGGGPSCCAASPRCRRPRAAAPHQRPQSAATAGGHHRPGGALPARLQHDGLEPVGLAAALPGETPLRRSVFIGTQNTYTPERYLAALAEGGGAARAGEAAYQRAPPRPNAPKAQALRAGRGAATAGEALVRLLGSASALRWRAVAGD